MIVNGVKVGKDIDSVKPSQSRSFGGGADNRDRGPILGCGFLYLGNDRGETCALVVSAGRKGVDFVGEGWKPDREGNFVGGGVGGLDKGVVPERECVERPVDNFGSHSMIPGALKVSNHHRSGVDNQTEELPDAGHSWQMMSSSTPESETGAVPATIPQPQPVFDLLLNAACCHLLAQGAVMSL